MKRLSTNAGSYSLTVLLGKLHRTFATAPERAMTSHGFGMVSLAAGDFNGDGRFDVGLANVGSKDHSDSGSLSVFMGDGKGGFPSELDDVSFSPRAVGSVDLDGDGQPDVALANDDIDSVQVALGKGNGTLLGPTSYANEELGGFRFFLRDVNQDGRLDAVVIEQNLSDAYRTLTVRLGKGDGTFGSRWVYGSYDGRGDVDVGDLDGDGRPDVVTTAANGLEAVLMDDVDQYHQGSVIPGAAGARCPALGDLNGDGKLDLVARSPADQSVKTWLGGGDGTFTLNATTGVAADQSLPTESPCLYLLDLDRDHVLDLVVLDDDLGVALEHGDGSFGPVTSYPLGTSPSGPVVPGDLNGDGTIDLVVNRKVLLGRGDGSFATLALDPFAALDATPGWPGALADFDGDGRPDLVVLGREWSNGFFVLMNTAR